VAIKKVIARVNPAAAYCHLMFIRIAYP